MIKNWLVKTKQIKKKEAGFISHVNYLEDKNRSSHHYTKITVLNNKASNILKAYDDRKAFRQKNGLRGGGVSNYATSFIMSLPRDIKQPTVEDWRKISVELIKDLAKENNLDPAVLRDHCHIVLHNEDESLDKPSHVHVLVSNVINNEVVKSISQYKSTQAVKNSFNRSVKAVLSEDNAKYAAKKNNVPKTPYWAYRDVKLKETIEDVKQRMIDAQKAEQKISTYLQKAKDLQESFQRWFFAFKESFYKASERHAEALNQEIDDMYSIDKKTAAQFDSEVDQAESQFTKEETPPEAKVSTHRKRRRRKT